MLSDFLSNNSTLSHVDLSFVNFSPKSLLTLATCNSRRKSGGLTPVQSWCLNGNDCSRNLVDFGGSLEPGVEYSLGLSAVTITTKEIREFLEGLKEVRKKTTLYRIPLRRLTSLIEPLTHAGGGDKTTEH
jgi:hypothetical protein